eukprot:gene5669-11442_t
MSSKKAERNKLDVVSQQANPPSGGLSSIQKSNVQNTIRKDSPTETGSLQLEDSSTSHKSSNMSIGGRVTNSGRGPAKSAGRSGKSMLLNDCSISELIRIGLILDARSRPREQTSNFDKNDNQDYQDRERNAENRPAAHYQPTRTSSAPPDEHAGGFPAMKRQGGTGFKPSKTFGKIGAPVSDPSHQPSTSTIAQYIPVSKDDSKPVSTSSSGPNPPSSDYEYDNNNISSNISRNEMSGPGMSSSGDSRQIPLSNDELSNSKSSISNTGSVVNNRPSSSNGNRQGSNNNNVIPMSNHLGRPSGMSGPPGSMQGGPPQQMMGQGQVQGQPHYMQHGPMPSQMSPMSTGRDTGIGGGGVVVSGAGLGMGGGGVGGGPRGPPAIQGQVQVQGISRQQYSPQNQSMSGTFRQQQPSPSMTMLPRGVGVGVGAANTPSTLPMNGGASMPMQMPMMNYQQQLQQQQQQQPGNQFFPPGSQPMQGAMYPPQQQFQTMMIPGPQGGMQQQPFVMTSNMGRYPGMQQVQQMGMPGGGGMGTYVSMEMSPQQQQFMQQQHMQQQHMQQQLQQQQQQASRMQPPIPSQQQQQLQQQQQQQIGRNPSYPPPPPQFPMQQHQQLYQQQQHQQLQQLQHQQQQHIIHQNMPSDMNRGRPPVGSMLLPETKPSQLMSPQVEEVVVVAAPPVVRKKPVLKDKSGRIIELSDLKGSEGSGKEPSTTSTSSSSHVVPSGESSPSVSVSSSTSSSVSAIVLPSTTTTSIETKSIPESEVVVSTISPPVSTETEKIPTSSVATTTDTTTTTTPVVMVTVSSETEVKTPAVITETPPVVEKSPEVVVATTTTTTTTVPVIEEIVAEKSVPESVSVVSEPPVAVTEETVATSSIESNPSSTGTVIETLPLTESSSTSSNTMMDNLTTSTISPPDITVEKVVVVGGGVVVEPLMISTQSSGIEETTSGSVEPDENDWEEAETDLNAQPSKIVQSETSTTVPIDTVAIDSNVSKSTTGIVKPPKKMNLKQILAVRDAQGVDGSGSMLDAYTTSDSSSKLTVVPASSQTSSSAVSVPVVGTVASTTAATTGEQSQPSSSSTTTSKLESEDDWDVTAEKISSEAQKPVPAPAAAPRSLRPMGGITSKKLNEGPKAPSEKPKLGYFYVKEELLKLRPVVMPEKPAGFNYYNTMVRTEPEDRTARSTPAKPTMGDTRWQKQPSPMGSGQQGQGSLVMGQQQQQGQDRSGVAIGGGGDIYGQGGGGGQFPVTTGQGSWQRGQASQVPPSSVPVPGGGSQASLLPRVKGRQAAVAMPKKIISDPLEILTRDVQAILNKITPQTFEKLTAVLCEIPIDTNSMLDRLVLLVFEKAIQEPSFANLYADMCSSLESESRHWAFLQVVFNKDSNQFVWVKDLTFDKELAGPYSSPKDCELAALAQTPPSFQPVNAKVQVQEVEVKSGILIKIFKNLENEEYFMSYMPYGDVDVSMVSQKAFPTQAAAEKDALTENSFRKRLIHLCQHEFYASVNIDENYKEVVEMRKKFESESSSLSEAERTYQLTELEDQERKMKRRMLGNMRFIGELYKKHLLKSGIMYEIFQEIVKRHPMKDEDIELLCKLLHTVGSTLEIKANSKKAKDMDEKQQLNELFDKISKLIMDKTLNSRMRFSLEEIVQLRLNKWQSRREQEGPATLEAMHEKIAREEVMKKMASQQQQQMQSHSQQQGGGGQQGRRGDQRYGYQADDQQQQQRYQDSSSSSYHQQQQQSQSYGGGRFQPGQGGGHGGGGGGYGGRGGGTNSPVTRIQSTGGGRSGGSNNSSPSGGSDGGRGGAGNRGFNDTIGSSSSGGGGGAVGLLRRMNSTGSTSSSPDTTPTVGGGGGTSGGDLSNEVVFKNMKAIVNELMEVRDAKETALLVSEITPAIAFELPRAVLTKLLKSRNQSEQDLGFRFIELLTEKLSQYSDVVEQSLTTCDDVIQLIETTSDINKEAPEIIGLFMAQLIRLNICRKQILESQLMNQKEISSKDEHTDIDTLNDVYSRLFAALRRN